MAYLFDPRRPADANPTARAMAMGLHAPTNALGPDEMRWDANGVAARAEMGPGRHPPRNPLIENVATTPSETNVVHSVRAPHHRFSTPDVGRSAVTAGLVVTGVRRMCRDHTAAGRLARSSSTQPTGIRWVTQGSRTSPGVVARSRPTHKALASHNIACIRCTDL
jgi:hypothetical protein